ncbi:hypothetical protein MUY21_06880 [Aliiroseovarius sp. S2029]|nr:MULTISPECIES: hypothetical protein [Aliiroseovarius]MCK8483758.1 hypothetical protein [Aliiroseovarius sp. S2029]
MMKTDFQRSSPPRSSEREAVREWLNRMWFTHFITLTSNNQMFTRHDMAARLRAWDARVNRNLVGPKWQKRVDERIYWIAFPEKADVNPHWHLLLQLLPEQIEEDEDRQGVCDWSFEDDVKHIWTRLVPSGTVDVQRIGSGMCRRDGAARYVTKSLGFEPNLESFVMSREYFKL